MKSILLVLAAAMLPIPAFAHHAFSKDYVADEIGTIEGEIIDVFYRNPHARYYVEQDDGQGNTIVWDAQTQNLTMLSRLGWKKDTFQIGDKVKITGNLGRDGKKRIFINRIENQDGLVMHPVWVTVDRKGTDGAQQWASSGKKSSADGSGINDQPAYGGGSSSAAIAGNKGASAGDFVGHWRITSPLLLAPVPGVKTTYDISIEKVGDGYQGWSYNGPFAVEVDGEKVVMIVDWTEGSDAQNKSKFIGTVNSQGQLVGIIDHGGHVYFTGKVAENAEFKGIRIDFPESEMVSRLPDLAADPVDMSGLWKGDTRRIGLNKNRFDLTETGLDVVQKFDVADAPQIRCAGYGLVNTFVFSNIIYDVEVFQDEEQVTILYGSDYVRRIYLDDRPYPENRQNTYLGFSRGEWKGNTLVVKTTNIAASFMRMGHGHPISDNAHTIEHYSLQGDGSLRADMWIFDAENYGRPPYFRAIFSKNSSPAVITKHGCDPKSFFRQMYLEGELDEFFKRAPDFHR